MPAAGLYEMEGDTQPTYAMARNLIHFCQSPLSTNDGVSCPERILSDRV